MQQKVIALTIASLSMMATGFAARKPRPTPAATLSAPKIPQMTDDQKALHALNRLTFGPRPGDLEQIKQTGLSQWIDQQLQPDSIPENPVLLAKIAPLDTLQMSTAAMLEKYPSQQMVRQIVDGKRPMPATDDPLTQAALKTAIARYEQKKSTTDAPTPIAAAPA